MTIQVLRQTSSAKKFRNPVNDGSAGTDSSGLASPQCLLEPNQLSVPKFSADDLEGAGALFKICLHAKYENSDFPNFAGFQIS